MPELEKYSSSSSCLECSSMRSPFCEEEDPRRYSSGLLKMSNFSGLSMNHSVFFESTFHMRQFSTKFSWSS